MEMFNTLVEAVLMSFFIGAIVGGAIVAHYMAEKQDQEAGELAPIKIRSDKDNR